jgi:glyoxylase-like metal-dependent hydrolase (beta-lactamase superfamily II)
MAEEWTELAPTVFVRRHKSLDLNIGAVIAEDGVIVIDTRESHVAAGEMAQSLRRITRLPVRWVVNTHHHWDHTFGNRVFAEADIWGHDRCAEVLKTRGEAMKQQVVAVAGDDAGPIAAVEITPPTLTFSHQILVTMGGVSVDMRHLGRGHTDNDIVIVLPELGVVFAGDLVEEGDHPSFSDAFPLEWPATLEAMLPLCSDLVVPGHGGIVSQDFVSSQGEELRIVERLARERHAAGMSSDEAAAGSGPYSEHALKVAFARAWPQLEAA